MASVSLSLPPSLSFSMCLSSCPSPLLPLSSSLTQNPQFCLTPLVGISIGALEFAVKIRSFWCSLLDPSSVLVPPLLLPSSSPQSLFGSSQRSRSVICGESGRISSRAYQRRGRTEIRPDMVNGPANFAGFGPNCGIVWVGLIPRFTDPNCDSISIQLFLIHPLESES
ncbi:hypothetical protein CRG98_029159 [Punica granatum]|uniref:Uncharacterized protein n=1 Tax=Punica granatum TaxID=22663 RepID=A0A2I0J2E2_PUNGR|nr:hypothetical protein CRG98_029159 [Punica granatum]